MKEIIIKITDQELGPPKKIEVLVDGKTAGTLTVGEMMEQVISLVHEELSGCTQLFRYPMMTEEEWAEREAHWKAPARSTMSSV